jgi:hypothetical protein
MGIAACIVTVLWRSGNIQQNISELSDCASSLQVARADPGQWFGTTDIGWCGTFLQMQGYAIVPYLMYSKKFVDKLSRISNKKKTLLVKHNKEIQGKKRVAIVFLIISTAYPCSEHRCMQV